MWPWLNEFKFIAFWCPCFINEKHYDWHCEPWIICVKKNLSKPTNFLTYNLCTIFSLSTSWSPSSPLFLWSCVLPPHIPMSRQDSTSLCGTAIWPHVKVKILYYEWYLNCSYVKYCRIFHISCMITWISHVIEAVGQVLIFSFCYVYRSNCSKIRKLLPSLFCSVSVLIWSVQD